MTHLQKFYCTSILAIGSLFSSAHVSHARPNTDSLSPARAIEVSVIQGQQLPSLMGKGTERFSVMAVVEGALRAIPFQFDDVNNRGFVYAPGGKLEINGEENVFEAQDQLAFMYKDTGPKASDTQLSTLTGSVLAELKFSDTGRDRFAYVVEGNSARSERHYTHYDRDTGLITTSAYSLQIDPDNLLMWADYHYKDFPEQRSLMDTMKVRIRVAMGPMKVTITNKTLPNRIVAVKNGPVRSIIEMDAGLSIFGIQLVSVGASTVITENSTEFPVYVTVPSAAAVLSKHLEAQLSLDLVDMEGMAFRSELGPKEPLVVGSGQGDPEDYKIDREHSWLSASSGKNWDVISVFKREDNFTAAISLLYLEQKRGDKPDKPERVTGSSPQFGYIIRDVPTGIETYMGFDFYYSPDFWQGNDVESAVEEIRNPVPVEVNLR